MRIEEIPVRPKEPKITRVAAYARVSSDKDAAFHSLEAQTEYYQNYIAAHPDWELVAIYSDNGISSKTINEIAAILTSMGVLTPAGRTKWSVSTVRSILSNEKYKGEALLQKTFTVDYLTKEVRKNNGEVPSVRVRNSHEPIIEPEVFDRVQEILAESIKRRAKVRTKLLLPGDSSVATAAPFMATKSGGCVAQANAITSGTATTSMMEIKPATLPDSGMRKSKRRLRRCCKSVVTLTLSIPMRDGISWWNPSRSAGAAT